MSETIAMAFVPTHDYFVLNNSIRPLAAFTGQNNEKRVYEVFRVEKGVPLFFEDHLARLRLSAKLANMELTLADNDILQLLLKLMASNKVNEGNIYLSFNGSFTAYHIPHHYPTAVMYRNGVDCGILSAERENPHAKMLQTNVRIQADELIAANNYYEVLLADQQGRITEGSRSNIFFVSGNEIVTPPGAGVLLGVTRKKAIFLATGLGFKLSETDIHRSDLDKFQAAFLTGTSPKILPVRTIKGFEFKVQNQIVRQLMKAYDDLIERYTRSFRVSTKFL